MRETTSTVYTAVGQSLATASSRARSRHKIQVFLGSYPTMRDAQQRVETGLVMLHPMYSKGMPGHHDLALIRLPKPVRLNGEGRCAPPALPPSPWSPLFPPGPTPLP